MISLLILTYPTFTSSTPLSALLNDGPELVGMIDSRLSEYDSPDNLDMLVDARTRNSNLAPLITAIALRRLDEHRLGALHLDKVIAGLPDYLSCFPDAHATFVHSLAGYEDFWKALDGAPFGNNLVTVLHHLVSADDADIRHNAKGQITKHLSEANEEGWKEAIMDAAEPFALACDLSNLSAEPVEFGTALSHALSETTSYLLNQEDVAVRQRWFTMATWVSSSARQTLFRTLRDQFFLNTSKIPNPVGILTIGGEAFISEGHFCETPDAFTRHVVLTLLRQAEGVDWLVENLIAVAHLIQTSENETKSFLSEHLSEQFRIGDSQAKARIERLAGAWRIPISEFEAAAETNAESTEDKS